MSNFQTCTMSEAQVQEAFLAAPPLIAQQILDLSVKNPSWLRDVPEMGVWPNGNGTVMEQIIFRGARPQIERGFDKWAQQTNNSGCNPCDGPNCSYNWTDFGGNGLQRKVTQLMSREFRSPSYCIKEIQTTAHFKEVFAKIIENLYAQVDFFKEQNIAFNFLTMLAKKYVVDGSGPVANPENPYVYRALGTAVNGTLNVYLLELFYEYMRRIPDAIPFDVVDGSPIFGLVCSHQTLAHLYRDDPTLRQDVRFSGLANDQLMKYNFMSSIRGMFLPAPILYPRRFNAAPTTGIITEVLPFINDVPAEVGAYTSFNPLYEEATYEEVLIHGKYPFKIFTMPTEQTLGENTSFGPEFSYFNQWMWVNPMTIQDPFRRVGYFATSAQIGLSQQFSDGLFGILVTRPPRNLSATYNAVPACPPEDSSCANTVPAVLCPCPLILNVTANPITAGQYYITLATPLVVSTSDVIQLGVDTGGYVNATVVTSSSNDLTIAVTFSGGFTPDDCDHFTSIFCDNTMGCSSNVVSYMVNCTDNTRLDLVLENPTKGDVSDTITIYYGDGTTASVTIVSFNWYDNTMVVDVGGSAFCNDVGGVIGICIPTAADSTCPACGGPTETQCAT